MVPMAMVDRWSWWKHSIPNIDEDTTPLLAYTGGCAGLEGVSVVLRSAKHKLRGMEE
jgi:hypothetical protein